jgi:hypothetical protein
MKYIEAMEKMLEGHIIVCTSIEDHNEYCIAGGTGFIIESRKPLKLRSKEPHYDSNYNYEIVGFDERFTNTPIVKKQTTLTYKSRTVDRITPLKPKHWKGTQEQYDDYYQYM